MYHIIMNPASSSGKGMRSWDKIKELLDKSGVAYEIHMLQKPGEAAVIAERLTGNEATITERVTTEETAVTVKSRTDEEDTRLLVIGGDGTLNEVLNGIVDFEHTTLSCVQTGSGNDFARNMHLEKDVERAVTHLLEQPEEVALDYGEVTVEVGGNNAGDSGQAASRKKRFLISSGVGYDANICEEVSRSRLKTVLNRLHLGKLVYVMIGVKQIFAKKTVRAKLYLDDAPMVKLPELFFVVGMNHMYEGGGIPFCPNADPTDGRLDVCLVKGMSRLKLLLAVVLVYFKKHLLFKAITNHRCRKMRLVTETPQWIHMDGETPYQVSEVVWESKGKVRFVR